MICTAVLLFAGLPRHHPHHLHRCASPASFAPLPHSEGFCFVFAGLPRHHPHHLHRCFAFCGFASASPASFAPLPHSAGCCFVIVCTAVFLLRVCFSITSIICTAATFCRVFLCLFKFASALSSTAVLLLAGLLQHHPHHLHRCFAFCCFASASHASSATLFC